ncbi:unnamed protein product [Spirodela intermedia]|uniref:Uncharacterized protein n=1 Tax=Spirodela intermedia TaxID=51605 RepID=A0A7I8J0Z7_SPIIN|nr:unnamed protein product [Spirodela intermedia]CAA6663807.1 unnamed protein product [Spirodela intermedia]
MNNLVEDHPCGLFCYFHPREAVIGVCAACLKEKLIVLASKQGRLSPAGKGHGAFSRIPSLKPSVSMPKVFALGSSLLHRLESRHQKPGEDSDGDSIASADDSFISIKFEDNGQVSWDKMAAAGERWGGQAVPAGGADVSRGAVRWRKRVRRLLHLVRWKRPAKAGGGACHRAGRAGRVGTVERMGWIRSLTRRTTTE